MSKPRTAKRSLIAAAAFLSLLTGPADADGSVTIVPHISIEPNAEGIVVTGHVTGYGAARVATVLEVHKSDASGEISSTQVSQVEVSEGEKIDVGHLSVGFSFRGSVTAELRILSSDRVIASTKTTLEMGKE